MRLIMHFWTMQGLKLVQPTDRARYMDPEHGATFCCTHMHRDRCQPNDQTAEPLRGLVIHCGLHCLEQGEVQKAVVMQPRQDYQ